MILCHVCTRLSFTWHFCRYQKIHDTHPRGDPPPGSLLPTLVLAKLSRGAPGAPAACFKQMLFPVEAFFALSSLSLAAGGMPDVALIGAQVSCEAFLGGFSLSGLSCFNATTM